MSAVLQIIKAWLSDNWLQRQKLITWLWKHYEKDMTALDEKLGFFEWRKEFLERKKKEPPQIES